MFDDRHRPIGENVVRILHNLNPGIVRIKIQAPHLELKLVMCQMHQSIGHFGGLPTDDPRFHLRFFLEVYGYFGQDHAKTSLNALPSRIEESWNDRCQRFLLRYNLPNMNAKLRNEITSFKQLEDETLYEAWERFKDLLRKCPMHVFQHWTQMKMFYNGLNAQTWMVVDPSANGAFLDRSYNEAYKILERIANNDYQYPTIRARIGRRVAGSFEVNAITSIFYLVSSLANMIKTMLLVRRFLDVLKQLHINMPFVEALVQMPNYAKFMKDILLRKRRLGEFETVALFEGCTAMLKNKFPPNLKNPGSFTIPCSIDNQYVGNSLCDLGSSINLMPMFVFKKLGIGEARPTIVTLQLADRSEGKIEDVLVRVDKFNFPVDFIVLDCEADKDVPIILGRPFLATGKSVIDDQKRELTMRVKD
ncbi:hypothetical protein EPI10_013525 [Gossypium australe]|uniref:Retrotransposon gag domain-containing protein n=1 Tax=Gossypium australe TaxID=47621 RepID=A0A5B6ULS1_9ROSI|nr:hypothetical protein EPI10_013525 [Gossypium australe]